MIKHLSRAIEMCGIKTGALEALCGLQQSCGLDSELHNGDVTCSFHISIKSRYSSSEYKHKIMKQSNDSEIES